MKICIRQLKVVISISLYVVLVLVVVPLLPIILLYLRAIGILRETVKIRQLNRRNGNNDNINVKKEKKLSSEERRVTPKM